MNNENEITSTKSKRVDLFALMQFHRLRQKADELSKPQRRWHRAQADYIMNRIRSHCEFPDEITAALGLMTIANAHRRHQEAPGMCDAPFDWEETLKRAHDSLDILLNPPAYRTVGQTAKTAPKPEFPLT
jgi:hypothetical protein